MSRRDEIIEAAIRLAESAPPGEAKLSVRTIAKEAGIGASTLRHYFPTQNALYQEVARRSMQTVVQDFAIADSSIDPAERLYEVCAQFLINDELRDIQLETWFKMHLNALGPDPREGSHELLRYGHEITYDSLHRWLGILADEGHIDPAEVAPSATLLFTAIDGMALHSIITPERMTVETVHDTVRWTIAKILD